MKKFSTLLASIALAVIFASPAFATTSSINPTQPAQNAPLLSATIRALALAAYNDITAIFGDLTVTANQFLGSTAGGQVVGITIPNCPSGVGYVSGGGFICAGASGITALTGDVIASGSGSVAAALNNSATARTNIGLGLASTPQFAGLTLTGVENINLNTGSLIAALTGTTLHQANVDGALNRHQLDAFGNSAHFSALRADGTAAAPTALQSADVIGSFNGWGYDGTTYGAAGSYQLSTSQIWTPSAHGSVASIWTTPNGTTTPIQQVIVGNDGGVTLGTPTGGDKGANTFNAAGTIWSNGVQLQNGALVAGTNITITGSWPNQTINATTTGGGGSGTVNSGTAGQLGIYSTTGTAISGSALVSATTAGLTLNGLNAIALPNSGADVTSLSIGPGALASYSTTTGNNVAAGLNAFNAATTAADSVVIGANAGKLIATDSRVVLIGSQAGQAENIGASTTAGTVAIGYRALANMTTGNPNIGIGYEAGDTISIATNNIMIGYLAGHGNIAGSGNIVMGNNSFQAAGGGGLGSNIVIGNSSAIALGNGSSNLILGAAAAPTMTGGSSNNCIGGASCAGVLTGSQNVVNGNAAGIITSGSNNTIMGTLVGSATGPTTGSSNILIGSTSAIHTPAAGTSNYLNIGNMLAGDIAKGILIMEGPTTVLTCGTSPTLKAGSNDMTGEVTVGTSSSNSCIATFANAHTAAPNCVVSNQTATVVGFGYSVSTTALTVTATSGLDSSKFDYHCFGGSTSTNPTP